MDTKEMRFMYTYLFIKGKQAGEGLPKNDATRKSSQELYYILERSLKGTVDATEVYCSSN